MKVILSFVLVAVASSVASPMFGASGMMKRRFPGAPDMTVRAYREITNNNAGIAGNAAAAGAAAGAVAGAAAGAAPPATPAVVARFGPTQQAPVDPNWMFANSGPGQLSVQPAVQSSSRPVARPATRPAPRPAATPVSTQLLGSTPGHQNSVSDFQYYPQDYPTNFYPRESYAHLQFPDEVSFDDYYGAGYKPYPKPIFMPKRHYY